jgi:hypothetical protein
MRVTYSGHCASKTAYVHTLVEDMHINFPIEDYRKELKWKISESVALKAPMCTLFNISLVHLLGPRSVYALPLSL